MSERVVSLSIDKNDIPFRLAIRISIGYTSIFLIGVLGNLLVILSVWRNQQLRTQINFFLANLAVADLLVNVICVPFTLVATIFPGM